MDSAPGLMKQETNVHFASALETAVEENEKEEETKECDVSSVSRWRRSVASMFKDKKETLESDQVLGKQERSTDEIQLQGSDVSTSVTVTGSDVQRYSDTSSFSPPGQRFTRENSEFWMKAKETMDKHTERSM